MVTLPGSTYIRKDYTSKKREGGGADEYSSLTLCVCLIKRVSYSMGSSRVCLRERRMFTSVCHREAAAEEREGLVLRVFRRKGGN